MKKYKKFIYVLFLLLINTIASAQDIGVKLVEDRSDPSVRTVVLSALPERLGLDKPGGEPKQVIIELRLKLFSSAPQWLLEKENVEILEERFVANVFQTHRSMQTVEDLRDILLPEFYSRKQETLMDSSAVREQTWPFKKFDDIRLLGSIRYSYYDFFLTQVRNTDGKSPPKPWIIGALKQEDGEYKMTDESPYFWLFRGGDNSTRAFLSEDNLRDILIQALLEMFDTQ
ncbi:MAG: hypothetical protein RQ899_10280 [Pseudomonadales bacterium]|nr:hypothetical protein [Pseudomonadales bacterium]